MSLDYVIHLKLGADFNEENILKVLTKGQNKNFIYYDHIFGELYDDAPIINPLKAAQKVMLAWKANAEGGAAVYTYLEENCSVHLSFDESEEGYLTFDIGCFNSPKKKGNFIDFAYYLRLFLDLCEDFPIVEVKTEMY